jgi:hypothetical protein
MLTLPINSFNSVLASTGNASGLIGMSDRLPKRYLFASDFDRTLTFNGSGYALGELLLIF